MFLVSDTIEARHTRIRQFFNGRDAAIAVLLAAADFERCIRRAILALGSSPTSEIRRNQFGRNFHGLDAFKNCWKAEVQPRLHEKLADDVVKNWGQFSKAFELRHRLIHGAPIRLSPAFATRAAERILAGTGDLHCFATRNGAHLDGVIRRYKRRSA